MGSPTKDLLKDALARRDGLIEKLHSEQTNTYRLFHGVAEGAPGLTLDRYDSLLLAQTFRAPLGAHEVQSLESDLRDVWKLPFEFAYNHRGGGKGSTFEEWHLPTAAALQEIQVQEFGQNFLIRARHQGIDPWLFLDFRAGRRALRARAKGKSVLNLFSYTCSVSVCAALSGASEVWSVDFAASNLEVGRRNAELNGIPEAKFRLIQEDCIPVMRQLAGMPAGGRYGKTRRPQHFDSRRFDIVILDPPAWSKSPFGAVDVAGDYPSLFKPAVLATREGGVVIATNHVASVPFDAWEETLRRCAAKAGRPLKSVARLNPEDDFPSFDGQSPLKIAVCEA